MGTSWVVLSFNEGVIMVRRIFQDGRKALDFTEQLRETEPDMEHDYQVVEND